LFYSWPSHVYMSEDRWKTKIPYECNE
jgi:hypothetical protein